MVADTSLLLNQALDAGETVLLRGRAGDDARRRPRHLSVRHLVSNPIAGGVGTGAGIGPTRIDRVIGVVKAYTTRVGSGPFPTELLDDDGEQLRKIGAEFGTTTGRPRRCGWYDAVIARYAARVNGLTDFFLTKLDCLGAWDEIPVCVAYEVDGERVDEMPMTQTDFHHAKPVYEMLPGGGRTSRGCRTFEELPTNAQAYVRRLEELSGAPIWASASARAARRRSSCAASTSYGARLECVQDRSVSRVTGPAVRRLAGCHVKTLVIGTGGREHALALALSRDPSVTEVHAAPGQPGDGRGRHPPRRRPDGRRGGRRAGQRASAPTWSWSVPRRRWSPGSPTPSARPGIACFGPSAAAARLEGSKAFAKDVMAAAEVPTAMAQVCETDDEAAAALDASARRTSSRTTGSPPARASW